MQILHSTGMPYPTKLGSFERWLVEVCRQAQLKGHRIYIAYTQSINGVPEYSKAISSYAGELVVLGDDHQIEAFCSVQHVDTVHFHFDFHSHGQLYKHLYKKGLQLYATLHCECAYHVDQSWKSKPLINLRITGHRLKTFWRARYFQKLLPCSKRVAQQYQTFYAWPQNKVRCLYLGVPHVTNAQSSINHEIPIITCIAFHSPIKGVDILLQSLKILKDRGHIFIFWQIGGGSADCDGTDTKELHSLCTILGLDDCVEWIGITNNVNHYLQQTDIYCQPSRTEAICLSIAEAMALRVPVVATNVGGIPELVTDEKNGFLVEPENPEALADRLELLLNSQEMRLAMGQQSLIHLQELNFFQENSISQLFQIYMKQVP